MVGRVGRAGRAPSGQHPRSRGEQITDAEPDDCPVRPAGRWIVDPDGAVVRAGLVRHYGARHGLWQLDPDIAYLSGDRLPPAVRGFEVLEQLAFDERRLRQALSALDCGALEILVRGVQVDPDALRRRLRLRGSRPLSAVITRIGSGPAESCDGLRLPSLAIAPGKLAAVTLPGAASSSLRGQFDDALSDSGRGAGCRGPAGLAGGRRAAVVRQPGRHHRGRRRLAMCTPRAPPTRST